MEPLRSVSDAAPADKDEPPPSKWTMRLYRSKEALPEMPRFSWLDYLGQEVVPAIDEAVEFLSRNQLLS